MEEKKLGWWFIANTNGGGGGGTFTPINGFNYINGVKVLSYSNPRYDSGQTVDLEMENGETWILRYELDPETGDGQLVYVANETTYPVTSIVQYTTSQSFLNYYGGLIIEAYPDYDPE